MNFFDSVFKIFAYVLYSVFSTIDADITYEAQFVSGQIVYLFSVWQSSFHYGVFSFTVLVVAIVLIPIGGTAVLVVFEPINQVVEAV
jgi:hypothetical protein